MKFRVDSRRGSFLVSLSRADSLLVDRASNRRAGRRPFLRPAVHRLFRTCRKGACMDPMRRVLNGVWALATVAALMASPAHAQFYEDVLRTLDLGPDPLARSSSMVAMGRLSLVLEDTHVRYDIWEF